MTSSDEPDAADQPDLGDPSGGATGRGGQRSPVDPDPAVDSRSDDDRDLGWGDDGARRAGGGFDEQWYREQRPPHWE